MRIESSTILTYLVIISTAASGMTNYLEKEKGDGVVPEYFSSGYEEAREKFLKACHAAGASDMFR